MTELSIRLTRAFERRFGKSLVPLVIRQKAHGLWRVIDKETGTWADYVLNGSRIRRVAELDNA